MEALNEPIQVVARFRDGGFEPTRFLWEGRPQRVKSITGRWASREGRDRVYHFAVVNENDTYFEISLHTRHMDWMLNRVVGEWEGGAVKPNKRTRVATRQIASSESAGKERKTKRFTTKDTKKSEEHEEL